MQEGEIWNNHDISFRTAVWLSKSDAVAETHIAHAEECHFAIRARSRQRLRLASSRRPQLHTSGMDERAAWPESRLRSAWDVVVTSVIERAHGLVPQNTLRSATTRVDSAGSSPASLPCVRNRKTSCAQHAARSASEHTRCPLPR